MQQQLISLLAAAQITLHPQQQQQLIEYVQLLDKWNQAYNLTAVRQPEQMLIRHIMDSLVVMPYLQGQRLIDVGTGAGLPGIPLAIALADKTFYLLDSLGKRIRFLKQVKHQLALTNIEIIQSRVEHYQITPLFDGVISRAFASLTEMIHWCDHLLAPQGHFYALKGEIPEQALMQLPDHLQLKQIVPLQVPQLAAERHLVIIQKQ